MKLAPLSSGAPVGAPTAPPVPTEGESESEDGSGGDSDYSTSDDEGSEGYKKGAFTLFPVS